jgi:hypothetical protein
MLYSIHGGAVIHDHKIYFLESEGTFDAAGDYGVTFTCDEDDQITLFIRRSYLEKFPWYVLDKNDQCLCDEMREVIYKGIDPNGKVRDYRNVMCWMEI